MELFSARSATTESMCVIYRQIYMGTFTDIPSIAADSQIIYDYIRGGYGYYSYGAYQYRDGYFECISSLEEQFMEDGSITYTVRDEEGNEEVYKDELPDKWAGLWLYQAGGGEPPPFCCLNQ